MTQNSSGFFGEKKEFSLSPDPSSVQMPVCDKIITSELSGDFVLPDYMPEIRRLIRVTPRVHPASKYVAPGIAEFAGSVGYDLLYTDPDGLLRATSLATDYEIECPIEGAGVELRGNCVFIDSELESLSCRPVGPRKVIIKSKLRSRVRAFADIELSEEVEGVESAEDAFSIERLGVTYPSVRIERSASDELTVSEEVALDQSDARPVYAEGTVYVADAGAVDGGVALRAEAVIRCVLEGADGGLYTLVRRLPFSETISFEGVERGCDCRAWGSIGTINLSVEKPEEDARATLYIEAMAKLEAEVKRRIEASVVVDAFSSIYESECEYRSHEIVRSIKTQMGNLSVGHSLPLSEAGVDALCHVIDAGGTVKFESVDISHGRYLLRGICSVALLLSGEETESAEFDIPFKYELDGEAAEECLFDCNGDVISMRARIEGENLAVDAELSIAASLYAKSEVRSVGSVRLDRSASYGEEKSGSHVVVCYPQKGESLWDVAKRYHISPKRIARSSGFEDIAASELTSAAHSLGIEHIIIEK